MSRDEKAAEVAAWFEKVRRDLRAAEIMLGADPPLPDDVAFHCQQAVEKALKALLVHRERRPAKSHDIRMLGKAIADTDPDLAERARGARWLTVFASEFRYPGDVEEPSEEDARQALDTARAMVSAVEERIARG
jgi:HEPN domain-containing protein